MQEIASRFERTMIQVYFLSNGLWVSMFRSIKITNFRIYSRLYGDILEKSSHFNLIKLIHIFHFDADTDTLSANPAYVLKAMCVNILSDF